MKKIFVLILVMGLGFTSFSQKFNYKKTFIKAERAMQLFDYETALMHYAKIAMNEPNANIHYLIGYLYFEKFNNVEKSIEYFEKAISSVSTSYKKSNYKETNAPTILYYYLGKCYHIKHQFDDAIAMYDKYRPTVIEDFSELQKLDKEKEYSNNAKELVKNPVEIEINLLGDNINTEYDEHSPVIDASESMIIFTSRRKGSTGNLKTNDGKFYEDIYISRKENNEWQPAQKISTNINTIEHEASIALSSDGRELFIFRDDVGVGNIYYSHFIDEINDWSKPTKLGSNINSTGDETHASISPDGQTLFFSSNRPGGFGGYDIYLVNKLPTGEWGWAVNAGEMINTPYDESGPYIHQDGYTLYFSSKGHNSMGGYDLFSTTLKDDSTFTSVKNLGYPINTIYDDAFYVLSTDGKRAYYSKETAGGKGGQDVFMMDLLSLPERSFVVVSGTIQKQGSNEILKDISIDVKDADSDKLIGKYRPNKNNGKYLIVVQRGKKYTISSTDGDVDFIKNTFEVPEDSSFFYNKTTLDINPLGIAK
ncbi:MAG: PD40 domain-containing protein [Bacteroidales bacterium]|nr:PD40 domain-containing protein [Bacteroidales bacterium]